MKTRWRKVFGDLRENPARFVLVGLAIFVGTAAFAAVLTTRTILLREVSASFQSSNPAAIIFTLDSVSSKLVEKTRMQPGIANVDARKIVRTRVEVAPGDWRTMVVFGVADFNDLRVSTFTRRKGDFPPRDGEILIEQSSLPVLKTDTGKLLTVRAPGGTVRDLRVGGLVQDAGLAPGWQDNSGYGYASPATLEMLGQGAQLDELRIAVGETATREEAAAIAADLSRWLSSEGREIKRIEIPLRRHPHADQMNTMLILLLVFSVLGMLLSGVSTANLMAAMMAKQARQIGVMKTLGANSGQIVQIYACGVLLIAVASIIFAIPLGAVLGTEYARFAAGELNLFVSSWAVPLRLYAVIVFVGIGVPLLSALVPVRRAVKIPIQKALQDSDIELPDKNNRFGKIFNSLTNDRRLVLALRNTFRRPLRMSLTLGALGLGGAMLLTGANVYSSLVKAVDDGLSRRGDNIDIRLLRPASDASTIIEQINQIGGVKSVEAWGNALVSFGLPQTSAKAVGTNRYSLLAPPENSKLADFNIIEGRAIEQNEANSIVVNRILRDTEKGLNVGAELNLVFGDRETIVKIVGITEEISEPAFYTNFQTLQAVRGVSSSAGGAFRIVTEKGAESKVAARLEQVLTDNDLISVFQMTRESLRQSMTDHFLILLFVLTALAVAALAVGSFGLATTMSLNVLERRREIGVIRAIGAQPKTVLRLILIEGLTIAALSIVLAIILSLPVSAFVGLIVGNHGLHVTLPFVVSVWSIFGWTILALAIAFFSCLFPALGSIKLSVRDTLAYE